MRPTVSVATAQRGDLELRLAALGTITPAAVVTVKAQISGQLQKINFTEGQMVREGDLLAQLDPSSYEVALHQAEGRLKRDQALLAGAKLQAQQEGVSPQQVIQKANLGQYEGAVDAEEAEVTAAHFKLSYTRILAPVTGRIGLRQVDPGNTVSPGDANGIAVITQLKPISALFTLPEDNVKDISSRLAQGTPLPVIVFDRANRVQLAAGKVVSLDNQIDTTYGTVKVRAAFDNADGTLFPNQFVNLQVILGTLHDQLLIPSAAVHRGPPGLFVYLLDTKTSTVSSRTVEAGASDGEHEAITAGLSAGDMVVTQGAEPAGRR
jgi:multidrug efflux system membrane fusion protein